MVIDKHISVNFAYTLMGVEKFNLLTARVYHLYDQAFRILKIVPKGQDAFDVTVELNNGEIRGISV